MANETSVDALLQAAHYLESTSDGDDSQPKKGSRYKRPANYCLLSKPILPLNFRTTHNMLEKNRRAQLRDCLEMLRESVPFSDKMTTLSLLQSARRYIVILRRQNEEQEMCKKHLQQQKELLIRKLHELGVSFSISDSNETSDRRQDGGFMEHSNLDQAHMDPPIREEECETEVIIDVDSNSSDADIEDSGSCTSGSDGGISNTTTVKWPTPVQEIEVVTEADCTDIIINAET